MKVAVTLVVCALFAFPSFAQNNDQPSSAPTMAQPGAESPQANPEEQDRPKTIVDAINITWQDEERDFVNLADAMPAAKWNYRPMHGAFHDVRTFAQMVKHTACANEAFAKEMHGEAPPENCEQGGPSAAKTKAQIMSYLQDSFQMLDAEIAKIDDRNEMEPVEGRYGGPNTKIGMVVLATWHVADMYGQMVEYARLNGIVPPASRRAGTPVEPQAQAPANQPAPPPSTQAPGAGTPPPPPK